LIKSKLLAQSWNIDKTPIPQITHPRSDVDRLYVQVHDRAGNHQQVEPIPAVRPELARAERDQLQQQLQAEGVGEREVAVLGEARENGALVLVLGGQQHDVAADEGQDGVVEGLAFDDVPNGSPENVRLGEAEGGDGSVSGDEA
jgi:hypothetical protein